MTSNDNILPMRRTLAVPLVIGILLFPVVFYWFTLRKGYSRPVRVLCALWFIVWVWLLWPKGHSSADPQAIASSPQPSKEVGLPYVHELPLMPGSKSAPIRTHFSTEATELKRLWIELEDFRFDPKFHVLGFDNPFQYGEWAGKVRRLDHRAGKRLTKELGFSAGELLVLGEEYRAHKGKASDRSSLAEARLAGALNQQKVEKGGARVTTETTGCSDFDTYARSLRLLEEGDFIKSNALLEQSGCETIVEGAIVGPPTRRRAYDWLKDKGQHIMVYVKTDHGDLWIWEDSLTLTNT